MNTPKINHKNMESSPSQTPVFEPFPEPRTMPKGWDFSGLESAESMSAAEPARNETEG